MKLLDVIRGERAPSAASLREAMAAAEQERGAALAEHDRLQARRAELLLADGADRHLDEIERSITRTIRQLDRLDLAVAQGQERLVGAETAERRERMDQIHAEAEAKLAAGVSIYAKELPPLMHKLRGLALELQRLQDAIDEANSVLLQAGDPRQVWSIDHTARPSPPDQHLRGPDLVHALRLPSTVNPWRNFFPHTDSWGQPLAAAERPDR
jgi:hypothetical protein